MDTVTSPTTSNNTQRIARVWQVKPAAPEEFLQAAERELALPHLTAQLLYNRNLTNLEAIHAYFKSDYNSLSDPFLIKDMDKAVARIGRAIEQHEQIAIYGDFDADGVTACSLLVQYFKALGIAVVPRIPHRVDEGYGLNPTALKRLHEANVSLVVTVDCGVSNVAEVALANEMGMDVIVTDHHRPPDELPQACAILNVRQIGDMYPYKGLAGVGVAFQLVRALTKSGLKPEGDLRPADLLDLVALGTVADIAPLTGENRVMVARGLKAINRTQRPGIVALVEAAGIKQGALGSEDIGFKLAPRINAAGRIDDAILAYELLLTDSLDRARDIAQQLNAKNRERQTKLAEILAAAKAKVIEEKLADKHKLMVLSGEGWTAGVVGLVAGRLAEEYCRPVLVMEQTGETCKGSARSTPVFNIIEALSDCADLLDRYGGHRQAAGFTLPTAKVPELTHRLQAIADSKLTDHDLLPRLEIDTALELHELQDAYKSAQALAPYGSENSMPLFASFNLKVKEARPVGADGSHLKLKLFDPHSGRGVSGIAFREGHRAAEFYQNRNVDVAYTVELNEWQGQRNLEIMVRDIRVSEK